MARNMYGATSADFTITSGGRVIPGAVLTLWTARTGGTQITDLLDVDSVACTTVTSAADGSVVYYGPNNDKTVHWADSGQGSRVAIRPVDITGEPPTLEIGTVTTDATADVTISGTSPEYTLDFVLPPVGEDGVNTAAIQDSAVTSAKIAADAASNGLVLTSDDGEDSGIKWSPFGIADLDIGTVATGTAGATLTGNPEDGYELDLTLPATGLLQAEQVTDEVPVTFATVGNEASWAADWEFVVKNVTFSGVKDPGMFFGYNTEAAAGSGGLADEPIWMMGMEAKYHAVNWGGGSDTEDVMEWYVEYRSPDHTSVSLRPFSCSVGRNGNSDNWAGVAIDIGRDHKANRATFSLLGSRTDEGAMATLLAVNNLAAYWDVPQYANRSIVTHNVTGQANQSYFGFAVNSVEKGFFTAYVATPNEIQLRDSVNNRQMVGWELGNSNTAAITHLYSSLRVEGDFSLGAITGGSPLIEVSAAGKSTWLRGDTYVYGAMTAINVAGQATTGRFGFYAVDADKGYFAALAAEPNTIQLRDQVNGNRKMVGFELGASDTAAVTHLHSSLKVEGNLGFYGGTPAAKPTVTGSRGSNAALASLITALSGLGLVTDSSS